ncbi:MAG: hypothetical protein CVV45_10620 [Spirochaetae bacterium HGW-Spirochaetae-10]|nr:MAG: hypothetical protein CVV45_10620 [Spirochaetae bacterium HGW-Spirochaetae-10]
MKPYQLTTYFARKKFWKLFGGEIRIFDGEQKELLFFVKQKAFKLKEDIRVFSDESASKELLHIGARSVIDFSASYDVTDATTNQRVGTIRRKGLKSLLRDSWELLDAQEQVIGSVTEDSMVMALFRRFVSALVPQSFHIQVGDAIVGALKQTFNPFVPTFRIDFSMDQAGKLDRRLGIATVVLLQIIEGKQQS